MGHTAVLAINASSETIWTCQEDPEKNIVILQIVTGQSTRRLESKLRQKIKSAHIMNLNISLISDFSEYHCRKRLNNVLCVSDWGILCAVVARVRCTDITIVPVSFTFVNRHSRVCMTISSVNLRDNETMRVRLDDDGITIDFLNLVGFLHGRKTD